MQLPNGIHPGPRDDQPFSQMKLDELLIAARSRVKPPKGFSVVLPPSATQPLPGVTPLPAAVPGAQTAEIRLPGKYDNLWHTLFMTLMVTVAAVGIARILVPEFAEYLNNVVKPWRLLPANPGDSSVHLLAEDRSVTEFYVKFRGVARAGEGASSDTATVTTGKAAPVEDILYSQALDLVNQLQRLIPELNVSTDEKKQRLILRDMIDRLRPLKSLSECPELRPVWQIASAAELFLKRLVEKEGSINSSVLRTIGQGVAVLAEMCVPDLNPNLLVEPPLRVLVVDDEQFSRFALCQSLERTLNKPEVADSAAKALEMAAKNAYDLIFTDVMMPEMDGFELCPKIHEISRNATTPVVFVTSLNDMNSRAKSVLSGGKDFLTKPFLTFEVTVKALTLVTRERLRQRGLKPAESVASEAVEAAA